MPDNNSNNPVTPPTPSFGSQLLTTGENILTGGLAGLAKTGLGLLFQGEQNSNQISQAQALGQIQVNDSEQLADYNEQEQMKLWQQTNYPAQVNELEQAGLNPALLYGKGGGGGGTTGVAAPTTESEQAPNNAATIMEQMQSAETAADIKLKNAQANKIVSDTPTKYNTGDVGAENTIADTGNIKADTALKQVNTDLASITKDIQAATEGDQITTIAAKAQQSIAQAESAMAQAGVDQATIDTRIQQAKENLTSTILQQNLTIAQGLNTQQATKESQQRVQQSQQDIKESQQKVQQSQQDIQTQQAQVKKWAQDIAQGWQNLSNQQKIMKINGIIEEQKAMITGRSSIGAAVIPMSAESMAKQLDAILGTSKQDY